MCVLALDFFDHMTETEVWLHLQFWKLGFSCLSGKESFVEGLERFETGEC